MDYFYMTKESEKKGQNPMLALADSKKKNLMAVATGSTGEVPWVAKKIAEEIETWGYGGTPIVLFSDNEPAILSLKKAVMARRDKETILMESIEGDSQANGVAERAVRTLEGQIRTLKAALEDKLGSGIDKEHPLWQWMVQWAAVSWNRFAIGKDGRTGWERVTGKRFSAEVA